MNISEQTKHVIDAGAASATGAAFLGYLPDVVAGLTAIWVILRIYETLAIRQAIRWIKSKLADT